MSEAEAAEASDLWLMRTLSLPSLPLFLLSSALSMGPVACSGDDSGGDSDSQGTATTTTSDTADMTDTESTSESTSGSTSGSTSESTSGSASNSASASGSTSDSTTTDTSGSTTGDTEGDTTTGASPELVDSCEAACATLVDCAPEDYGPLDECIALCIEDAGSDPDPFCESGLIALNQCYASALCEDIESLETCADEEEEVDEECAITECTSSQDGNEEGTECSILQECVDSPTLELTCNTELCECFEGGEKTGECATEGNQCADPGSLYELSFECCGW